MRALTLTQPWASLVALGVKRVETRSFRVGYRGPLAIHAAKGWPLWAQTFAMSNPECRAVLDANRLTLEDLDLARGHIVALTYLVDVVPTDSYRLIGISDRERAFGDYSAGRFAWLLADVEPLTEWIPARGALGLWRWPQDDPSVPSPNVLAQAQLSLGESS